MFPRNPFLENPYGIVETACRVFGGAPVQRTLREHGIFPSGPPPVPPAKSITVVVRDKGGIDCDAAMYVLAAGRGLAVSVWVTHAEHGSFQVLQGGRFTRTQDVYAPHFRRGSELTITADGPDAGLALKWARELLKAHPQERGSICRQLRKGART